MNRLEELMKTETTAKPAKRMSAPKGWEPGIEYRDGVPTSVTTPNVSKAETADSEGYAKILDSLDWELPQGSRLELDRASYDEAAWTRRAEGEDAVTAPVWRYKFKVVTDPHDLPKSEREELLRLAEQGKGRPPKTGKIDSAYVVAISDPQIGKAQDGPDADSGTDGTVQRMLDTLDVITERIKETGPAEVLILDVGDAVENVMNTDTQFSTNDLDLTTQIRVWRRLLMRYVSAIAPLTPRLTVAGVPSNHGQYRKAKGTPASGPWDDFGLETLVAVQDAMEAVGYDNVYFAYPRKGEETLTVDVANTGIGVFHGHQSRTPDKTPDWIGKQVASMHPLHDAQVIVSGHFHSFRYQTILNNRAWLQCPTIDPGSQWFTRATGEWSAPGLLTFDVADGKLFNVTVN